MFRTTIKGGLVLAMRKNKQRPRGGAVRHQAWEERPSPANLTVGNRRECGRDIRVAQVDGWAPVESPLAGEEIDEKGKHGGHRIGYCAVHKYAVAYAGTSGT